MHEWSFCENIVRVAAETWRRLETPQTRLKAVHVAVGAMRQIVPENMEAAYETLTSATPLKGSRLVMRILPVIVRCGNCGAATEIEPPFFVCRQCGNDRTDVIGGNELVLEKLEVEEGETNGNQGV